MRVMSQTALEALEEGTARITAAIAIDTAEPLRVWGGQGYLTLEGETYSPIGDSEVGIATGATIGGVAQNMSLSLSGIEPEILELLDAADAQGAGVAVWTVLFDSSGTQLLDAHVHRRGRIDRLPVSETAGGTSTITAEVESPGRGLGRRTGRMRSDADQRLINSSDGSMRLVSFAAEKTLYWGGRRPSRAGSSVGGTSAGGSRAGSMLRSLGVNLY